MNKRIWKKIIRRIDKKFELDKRRNRYQFMKQEEIDSILTEAESRVWFPFMKRIEKITNEILREIEQEELEERLKMEK